MSEAYICLSVSQVGQCEVTVQLFVTKSSDVVLFVLLISSLMTLVKGTDALVRELAFFALNYEILAVKRCFRPVLYDARLKRISRYGKRIEPLLTLIELDNQKLSFPLRKANNCRSLLLSSLLNQVL